MQKRISAVILLIAFLALIVLLTVNGIPSREEYREEYEEKFGTSAAEE